MRGKIPPFLRVPPSFPCSHAAAQSLAPTLRARVPGADGADGASAQPPRVEARLTRCGLTRRRRHHAARRRFARDRPGFCSVSSSSSDARPRRWAAPPRREPFKSSPTRGPSGRVEKARTSECKPAPLRSLFYFIYIYFFMGGKLLCSVALVSAIQRDSHRSAPPESPAPLSILSLQLISELGAGLPESPAPPSILSLQFISELRAGLPVLLTTSRQPPILTREREYMLTLLHHPTLSSRTLSSSPFSASASPPLPCESELLL